MYIYFDLDKHPSLLPCDGIHNQLRRHCRLGVRPRHRIVWRPGGRIPGRGNTRSKEMSARGGGGPAPALCWQIKFNFKPRVSMEINQNNEIWFQIFDNKKLPPIKVVCTVLAVVALLSYHRTKMSAITRYTHNTAPIVEHGLAQMWRRLFTRSLQCQC